VLGVATGVDGSDALQLWDGLVAGRWALVDKAVVALKKLEEENAGEFKKFAAAVGEVVKILTELRDKLMAVLKKGLETIRLILADPIGFLGNLGLDLVWVDAF